MLVAVTDFSGVNTLILFLLILDMPLEWVLRNSTFWVICTWSLNGLDSSLSTWLLVLLVCVPPHLPSLLIPGFGDFPPF